MRCLLCLTALLVGIVTSWAAAERDCQRLRRIRVRLSGKTAGDQRRSGPLIPLAKTDAFQTVTQEEINIPIKWEKIKDRDYGNDICVLHPLPADSGKTIELRYRVVRKEKSAYAAKGEDTARFLRPEKLVPANETFKTLAEQATAGKKTISNAPKRFTITCLAECVTTNQGPARAKAMPCMRATPRRATAVIFILTLLRWRALLGFRRALPSVRPFPPTKRRRH